MTSYFLPVSAYSGKVNYQWRQGASVNQGQLQAIVFEPARIRISFTPPRPPTPPPSTRKHQLQQLLYQLLTERQPRISYLL